MLRDISEIGIACVACEPIEEMTIVGIDFSLPGATDRHHVKGAIVRNERLPDEAGKAQWDIAVYFTEITPITKAALHNYVTKSV